MSELLPFLMKHWIMSLVFLGSFVWVIVAEMQAKLAKSSGVTSQQATMMMNHDNAVVIDIRSNNAFHQGHIVDAKHLPLDKINDDLDVMKQYQDQTCILVCERGMQATKLANKLHKQGFEKVSVLIGGMESWTKDELPVVK